MLLSTLQHVSLFDSMVCRSPSSMTGCSQSHLNSSPLKPYIIGIAYSGTTTYAGASKLLELLSLTSDSQSSCKLQVFIILAAESQN